MGAPALSNRAERRQPPVVLLGRTCLGGTPAFERVVLPTEHLVERRCAQRTVDGLQTSGERRFDVGTFVVAQVQHSGRVDTDPVEDDVEEPRRLAATVVARREDRLRLRLDARGPEQPADLCRGEVRLGHEHDRDAAAHRRQEVDDVVVGEDERLLDGELGLDQRTAVAREHLVGQRRVDLVERHLGERTQLDLGGAGPSLRSLTRLGEEVRRDERPHPGRLR